MMYPSAVSAAPPETNHEPASYSTFRKNLQLAPITADINQTNKQDLQPKEKTKQ
jgi:hypothetical protein